MARKLDLSEFEKAFAEEKDFELTEEEYKKWVNKELPQSKYFEKRSPVAKKAKEAGYEMRVEERIHRVVIFTKKEDNKK